MSRRRHRDMNTLITELGIEFPDNTAPDWFPEALRYALFSLPSDNARRDGQIFLDYFLEGTTLEELGKRNSLSTERVRQIIWRCRCRLRHPVRRCLLTSGIDDYYAQAERIGYQKGYAYARGCICINDIRLQDCDVSTRLRVRLGASGYHTIGEVVAAGSEKIQQIRGLGRKTYYELVSVLTEAFGKRPEGWELSQRPASRVSTPKQAVKETITKPLELKDDKTIWELDLSPQLHECLVKSGYWTILGVLNAGRDRIRGISGMNDQSYGELVDILTSKFGAHSEDWLL